MKPLRFTRRSRRHKIGRASALYVIENTDAIEDVFEPTGDIRYTWHGLDNRGRELEIIALNRPDCISCHPRHVQLPRKEAMTRQRRITPGPIGPDIDLDTEVILLADGTRLTNELAEEIAEDAIASHRGRPSITGASEHTPRMTLRVPERTRHALEEIASRQGRRLADVGREALDEYVRRHAGRAS